MNTETNLKAIAMDRQLLGKLKLRLQVAGCFEPTSGSVCFKAFSVLVLFAIGFVALMLANDWWIRALSMVLVAFTSVQAGLVAHEICHGAIAGIKLSSAVLGNMLTTIPSGLSYAYFKRVHLEHHRGSGGRTYLLNRLRARLDQQARNPVYRYCNRALAQWLTVMNGLLISLRAVTYKTESIGFLLSEGRQHKLDILFYLIHVAIWFTIPAALLGWVAAVVNYVVITLIGSAYLVMVFALNHVDGFSRFNPRKTGFLSYQLESTRNLGDSRIENFFFGNLNHHIEHHLFPGIPGERLPNARRITRTFCQENGLRYRERSLAAAIWHRIDNALGSAPKGGIALRQAGPGR